MSSNLENIPDEGIYCDGLRLSPEDIAELRRRCAELDADPSIAITEEEMWRRVDEALAQSRADRASKGN